jgi:hypothetical protein
MFQWKFGVALSAGNLHPETCQPCPKEAAAQLRSTIFFAGLLPRAHGAVDSTVTVRRMPQFTWCN